MEKKKSFIFGYSQILNWFIAWGFLSFNISISFNFYRSAIVQLHKMNEVSILDITGIIGIVGSVVFFVLPNITRRCGAKSLLVVTALLAGISYAIIPLFNNELLVGILIGLNNLTTQFMAISATMVLCSKWFPRTKGNAMGIATAGGVMANIVMLPIFSKILIAKGITMAMLVFGIALIIYGIVSIFWLKETPEEAGLLPDNKPMTEEEKLNLSVALKEKGEWRVKDILLTKKFWFLNIGWGLTIMSVMGFISTQVAYMTGRGVPFTKAIWALGLSGIIGFFLGILSGWSDDKFGTVKTSVWVIAGMCIGFLIAAFYGGTSMFLVILSMWIIVGLFNAPNNLFASQGLAMFGTKDFVIAYNMFLGITGLIRTFGYNIVARSLAWTGSYSLAYAVFAGALIVGLIFVVLAGDKLIHPNVKKSKECEKTATI